MGGGGGGGAPSALAELENWRLLLLASNSLPTFTFWSRRAARDLEATRAELANANEALEEQDATLENMRG